MLRAVRSKGMWWCAGFAVLASSTWMAGVAAAATPVPAAGPVVATAVQPVALQYRLLTEFTGAAKSGGRIIVTLTNRSPQTLGKVTVRLADPALGKLTGPVQESVELAAGETRQLEGNFVLDSDVVRSARPLDWIVLATESTGFAQQMVVRGEVQQTVSIDADQRTATH